MLVLWQTLALMAIMANLFIMDEYIMIRIVVLTSWHQGQVASLCEQSIASLGLWRDSDQS